LLLVHWSNGGLRRDHFFGLESSGKPDLLVGPPSQEKDQKWAAVFHHKALQAIPLLLLQIGLTKRKTRHPDFPTQGCYSARVKPVAELERIAGVRGRFGKKL
jgi:hypothetical protein